MSGGNDSLSMLAPYNDPFYASRRPTLAIPAGQVLQIGTDSSKVALGLHPRLTGLKQIFDQGRLALDPAHRLREPEPLALSPAPTSGRPPTRTTRRGSAGSAAISIRCRRRSIRSSAGTRPAACRTCCRRSTAVPAIASPAGYAFSSPNAGAEAAAERSTARAHRLARAGRSAGAGVRLRQHAGRAGDARSRRDGRQLRAVSRVSEHRLRAGAAGGGRRDDQVNRHARLLRDDRRLRHALRRRTSTPTNGAYYNLMATLNDGLLAFYNDLKAQGLLEDTLVLSFSEFGRRISENGSQGTDHGSASVMMAMGGKVNGGLYGTAPEPEHRSRATRRSRTTPATSSSRPTSARSTRRSSTAGWAPTRRRCWAVTSARAASAFI